MQSVIKLYYLFFTDCGLKNSNSIVYLGIILAVLNTNLCLCYRLLV